MSVTAEPALFTHKEAQPLTRPVKGVLFFQHQPGTDQITPANPGARAYLGMPTTGEKSLTIGIKDASIAPELSRSIQAQRDTVTKEQPEVSDITEITPGTWTKVTTCATFNTDGKPVSYDTFCTDVTDVVASEKDAAATQIRQMRTELQNVTDKAREQVESAEENARIAFETASTIAHDVRSPLAIVLGYADLLLDPDGGIPPADRTMVLEKISDQVKGARAMLTDYLALMALECKGRIELGPVPMRYILQDLKKELEPQIKAHNATVTIPDDMPSPLGVSYLVHQVMTNYLSNALKYGGKEPHVEIRAVRLDDGRIRYEVEDHGKGIPEDKKGKLFTKFGKLGLSEHSGIPSVGLGLSIVKRMVELQGGEVGCDSEVGKGSIFYFILKAVPESETVPVSEA